MKRFAVHETATEKVTYLHIVEADSEDAAKTLVEEHRTSDQGQWMNTDTIDREITRVENAL